VSCLYLALAEVDSRTQLAVSTVKTLQQRLSLQLDVLAMTLTSLQAPLTGSADTVYWDAHALGLAVLDPASTAWYFPEYGMFAPVSALAPNRFALQDALGQTWVPTDSVLDYSLDGGSTWNDTDGTEAFDGDPLTAWSQTLGAEVTTCTIRATLPLQSQLGALTTALVIHPEPAFGAVLHATGSSYQVSGTTQALFTQAVGWHDPAAPTEVLAQPECFFLPPGRVRQAQFAYTLPVELGDVVSGTRRISVSHLGAYAFTYQASATVVLDVTACLPLGATLTSAIANPTALTADQPVAIAAMVNDRARVTTTLTTVSGIPQTLRALQLTYS
jgi:hypothetical protein